MKAGSAYEIACQEKRADRNWNWIYSHEYKAIVTEITNKLQKYQKSTCQGVERCDSISELSARQ